MPPPQDDAWPLMCDGCRAELHPGQGDYYVVKISAVADPCPPRFSEEDLAKDIEAEVRQVIEQLELCTPREAREQVFRQLELNLCLACLERWFDDPTAGLK
jgi:hypothetical protein